MYRQQIPGINANSPVIATTSALSSTTRLANITLPRRCLILETVNELVAKRYVTDKRPNPKARKKLKKLLSKSTN